MSRNWAYNFCWRARREGKAERIRRACADAPAHVIAVSICKHCDAVIDFITSNWIKRETDGVYCDSNPHGRPGLAGFKWGKHEPVASIANDAEQGDPTGLGAHYAGRTAGWLTEPILFSDMHVGDKTSFDKFMNFDYSKVELRLLAWMGDQIKGEWRRMKTTLERHHADGYSLLVEDIPAADVPKIQAAVQHAAFGVAPHLAPIPEGKYLLSHAEMDNAARNLAERADKISAIRLVRACTGWDLKAAKDYVERLTGVKHG